jgi:hypothetical protein
MVVSCPESFYILTTIYLLWFQVRKIIADIIFQPRRDIRIFNELVCSIQVFIIHLMIRHQGRIWIPGKRLRTLVHLGFAIFCILSGDKDLLPVIRSMLPGCVNLFARAGYPARLALTLWATCRAAACAGGRVLALDPPPPPGCPCPGPAPWPWPLPSPSPSLSPSPSPSPFPSP